MDDELAGVRSDLDELAAVVELDQGRLDVVLTSTRRLEAEVGDSLGTLTPAADALLDSATDAVSDTGDRLVRVLERVDGATARLDTWMGDAADDGGVTMTLVEILLVALTVLAAVATASLVVRTTTLAREARAGGQSTGSSESDRTA